MKDTVVRLLVADDHELVRSGIKAMVSGIGDVEVIAEARDGQELIALVDRLLPDMVMTDLDMPGIDGFTAIAQIHRSHPQVKLLVLSGYKGVDVLKRAVESGACGYVMKDAPTSELQQAVRSVIATGRYFSTTTVMLLLQSSEQTAREALTERQVEILTLLAGGLGSKEIAFKLGLSPKTVDVHRARIMARLEINDVASLALYAARKGLIKI